MLRPTELPPASAAPRLAASMIPGTATRADDEALGMRAEGHGPLGDAAGELAGIFVIAGHFDDRARGANFQAPFGSLASPGTLLHLLELGHRLPARLDARRAEHHDRVSHVRAPQPDQGIKILRQYAQRACAQAVHENRIFVCQIRHRQIMRTTRHPFPLRFLEIANAPF